jgi:hypothetical protein
VPMRERMTSGSIANFAAFATAISVATGRVNDFSAGLGVLSKTFGTAARQIAGLSSSAAQMMVHSQGMMTRCQHFGSASTSEQSKKTSSYLEKVRRVIVPGALFWRRWRSCWRY